MSQGEVSGPAQLAGSLTTRDLGEDDVEAELIDQGEDRESVSDILVGNVVRDALAQRIASTAEWMRVPASEPARSPAATAANLPICFGVRSSRLSSSGSSWRPSTVRPISQGVKLYLSTTASLRELMRSNTTPLRVMRSQRSRSGSGWSSWTKS